MSTQPEALRLAECLESFEWENYEVARELRRLHAANIDCVNHFNAIKAERDELLEALKLMRDCFRDTEGNHGKLEQDATDAADAAIFKASA